jgi:hypothetical protein
VPGFPPVPTPASSIITPAPSAQANNNGATPAITFTYSGSAGTNPGTIGPSDFTVSSTEAINIPGNVHVYQNYRDSVSTGTIVPVAINALTTEGLADIVLDSARQKLYIANAGLNRLEVYDLKLKAFGTPIKVGQLPISMAFGSDGNTLYAANAGGESISVVDLTKQLQTGLVAFPAIPLNVSVPIYSPVAIAVSAHGPIFVMSNGTTGATLWKIDSNTAIPRTLNSAIFGAATTTTVSGGTSATTAYWSLAATAEGNYVFLMTGSGTGYIYSAAIDDFTLRKPIFTGTLTGYRGPVAAGPQGAYYAVGGTFLNASLTPVQGSTNASSPTGRPVAAVTAVSATRPFHHAHPYQRDHRRNRRRPRRGLQPDHWCFHHERRSARKPRHRRHRNQWREPVCEDDGCGPVFRDCLRPHRHRTFHRFAHSRRFHRRP